ncbi:hypothetical protein [Rhodovarius lipocyclicus]|uniref:hypothetical protein n=1 Tax=Rhodovarius lipocyclicus TaxID=268410 RepID=UPI001F18FCF1|nr:hypothetical protein [Rhodovarius lipocyclicus]
MELLARNARRVSLTDAGRAFLHEIRPVLAGVRQARKGDQVQALKDRRLSVGFVRSLTQDDELAHALVLEEPLLAG